MADQNKNTQTPPPVIGGKDNDKTMAIIAYIIFFIPLLAVKNRSAFLNYHINQGLSLFIVALAGSVVLSAVFSWRFYMLGNLWNLLMIILAVLGIISASKNETKPLPVIGNWFHIIK
jgi:uncharacterized membrane protein